MSVGLDMSLTSGKILAEKKIEYICHLPGIFRIDPDEPSRLRVHGRLPHHLRLVLTETLGSLKSNICTLGKLTKDIGLLFLVKCEEGLVFRILALLVISDLKKRRFGDIYIALVDQCRHKTVYHCKDKSPDLESVDIGIGTDYDLVPTELIEV